MFYTTSALDIFAAPAINASIDKTQWITYQPLSALSSGPIEFLAAGTQDYVDLSKTLLQLKVRVVKTDGTKLTDQVLAPTNAFLHSMFSKVDVFLNDTQVTTSGVSYAHKAYLQTLLNYGSDAKNSQLYTSLFTPDRETDVANMKKGDGYAKRQKAIEKSKPLELLGQLYVDVFHQNRYLLDNVSIKVVLNRSEPDFCLISETFTDLKVVVDSAVLHVRKVRVTPSIQLAQAEVLAGGNNALYPINQTIIKTFAIPQGLSDVTRENLFYNRTPIRVVLGLVSTNAYNGEYKSNPFEFKHYNLNYLSFHLNGQQIPHRPFTPDFDNGLYAREFLSTFQAAGLYGRDKGFDISYDIFPLGNALYAYDLTPDETAGSSHEEVTSQGQLAVEMKFSKPLPENCTCLILAEFESTITIDKNRAVTLELIS